MIACSLNFPSSFLNFRFKGRCSEPNVESGEDGSGICSPRDRGEPCKKVSEVPHSVGFQRTNELPSLFLINVGQPCPATEGAFHRRQAPQCWATD